MARVEDRFVGDDLELAAAGDGRDGGRRLAGIGERAAARGELLRIAALILLEPRFGLLELEMRVHGRSNAYGDAGNGQREQPLVQDAPPLRVVRAGILAVARGGCPEEFSQPACSLHVAPCMLAPAPRWHATECTP